METAIDILIDIVIVIGLLALAVLLIWIVGALTVFITAKVKNWFK
ncbi:MAG TPA: hypothetical protein VFM69_15790 [Pricia sp.]|nr:hypothetical protein [Pricia sp.]